MKRAIVIVALIAGCAHTQKSAQEEQHVTMEPMVFAAQPNGSVETVDAASLFERGGAAYGAKDFDAAVALFDRVVREWPDSRYVVPALYNAGLALEAKGELAAAAERYKRITVEHADAHDAPAIVDAWYRLGFVLAEAKNWPAAVDTYGQILQRKDLTLGDRLEALARRGVAQLNARDIIAAEHSFRDELAFYRAHESEERLDSDFFVAMGAYYLGECAHEQYRSLPVRLPEKQLSRDLEAKARLLLVAQSRFIDAMRVNNVEWATAAGFQIGSLYREFYDDMVGAPVPPALKGEARDVYLEEVRKQVKTLLQKAISIHEKNVLMAERVGEKNQWVQRSNEQMEQLKKLLAPGPVAPQPPDSAQPPAEPQTPPLPRPRDEVKPPVVL
ncbi:MAG: domain protein, putative component of TonB system [bacterium]|nr:domain protein, putative component of TonB system [bacterium]